MKKIIALLLCFFLFATFLAGCSTLKEGEKGASISAYFASFPQTLDPAIVQLNSDVSQILGLIFESLTRIDEDGKVVGGLAEKWYYSYDTREEEHKMFFELKETAWSDKRPVSADDVVYAWKRILMPETESPYAAMLFPLKNAKAVKAGFMTTDDLGLAAADDKLLEVTFEQKYDVDLFAETVSNIHLCPIREDIVARALNSEDDESKASDEDIIDERIVPKSRDWAASAATLVSNGPYRVQALDEGSKLVLERNTYYLRDDDHSLDKYVIPYRIVCLFQEHNQNEDSSHTAQLEYQAQRFNDEKIFYLSGFTKDTYSKFSEDIETSKTLNSYVYYFNTKNEVLSDSKVRRALSVALDRNKIANEVTGTGEIAATGYVPSGVFNTNRKDDFRKAGGDLNSASADIEKAESLLGGKKGSFTLTYLIPESKDLLKQYNKKVKYTNVYEDIAKYAKDVWESIGFNVELRGLNPTDYLKALYDRDYDVLGINNIINSTDAFAYLAPFATHYSGSYVPIDFEADAYTPHYTNLENGEYDSLIDAIVFESNRDERAKKLHEAEEMFTDLCPATALYYYTSSYVVSNDLKNVKTEFYGWKNFNKLKLKNYREINSIEEAEAMESE